VAFGHGTLVFVANIITSLGDEDENKN